MSPYLRRVLIPALLMAGCATHPPAAAPALPAPQAMFAVDHFSGSLLSGPTAGPAPAADAAQSLDVRVIFVALEKAPAAIYSPLGGRTTFVSATGDRNAVLASTRLLTAAQVLDLHSTDEFPPLLRRAAVGRITTMATLRGSLPPGVTAAFSADDPEFIVDPVTGSATHPRLQVEVYRPTDPGQFPRIALVTTDLTSTAELRTEKALIDLPSADNNLLGLTIPFRFDHSAAKAVAILIAVSPGNDEPAHVTATNTAMAQLALHASAPVTALSTGQPAQSATLSAAIAGLQSPVARRSSLVFLADQTGAALCEDVALEADDALIAKIIARAALGKSADSPAVIGWKLDRAALAQLASLLEAGSGSAPGPRLSEELAAVLAAHTGEVGRHASSLADLLTVSTSRQDMDNRLIAENTIDLEDSSPGVRVRAFDWLQAHGHAPAGFDPLAKASQRQAQLEQAASAPTTVPATQQ